MKNKLQVTVDFVWNLDQLGNKPRAGFLGSSVIRRTRFLQGPGKIYYSSTDVVLRGIGTKNYFLNPARLFPVKMKLQMCL